MMDNYVIYTCFGRNYHFIKKMQKLFNQNYFKRDITELSRKQRGYYKKRILEKYQIVSLSAFQK